MHSLQNQRLAVFLPGLYGGGAERTMMNLAHGIARRGYAVDLVLSKAEGPYLDQVPKALRLVDLSSGRLYQANRTLLSLPALVHYLRQVRPTIMLSGLSRANLAAILAKRMARVSLPIVISERNTLSLWGTQSHNWRNRLAGYLARRAYHWADKIIAVSNGVADDLSLMTQIPRQQIQVMYNPIVTPELKQKINAPLEHPWFQPGQPPVILAVGNMKPQKDFGTAIRAFAQVRKKRNARLLILGDGQQRPKLERLVTQLNLERDVSLPGWVDNPYPYMVRSDLFMLSSQCEGLPGVLIEALYCGLPLVATDCPSGPREILAEGRYGQLVPVGDVDGLAQATIHVLDGKTERAPAQSWQPYELESVVDRYIHLLFKE